MRAVDPDAKVTLACPICGREFWRWRSQAKWRGARFCSKRCQDEGSTRGRWASCKQCGNRFRKPPNVMNDPGRGKFCGRACYGRWQQEHRQRVVHLTCPTCGGQFERPAAWVKRGAGMSCSRRCAGIARQRGPSLPRRGRLWREFAESIRERDGQLCVRCGQPEPSDKSLNVDHILPARLFESDPNTADNPLNLASLCTSCHAIKTHRYEPRILRGDFLAIEEFYDQETRLRVMGLLP